MADKYRRRKSSDTWHFCTNCSKWPTRNYEQQTIMPKIGKLCDECRAKRANRNCR